MPRRGFGGLRADTARQYLSNWYAKMIFHTMRRKNPATSREWIDVCARRAMIYRRKLLSGEKAVRSIDEKDERYKLDGRCVYCDQLADSVDHLIPRLRHGPDSADNLVPACRACNSSKGGRDVFAWAATKGFCPLKVHRRYLVLAWNWTNRAGLLDASFEALRASNPPFRVNKRLPEIGRLPKFRQHQ